MRHAICYISNKSPDLNQIQITELLESCKAKNESVGIKGLLLYSEFNFFQILEGEKQLVLSLYEQIKLDPRHYGLIQILGRDIERGSFDGYQVDIIGEDLKLQSGIPEEYIEALKGIPTDVRKSMERMLERFIATR